MAASFRTAGRSPARGHATSRLVLPISATARACAQEADAALTRDDWPAHDPGVTSEAQRLAESKYFLY